MPTEKNHAGEFLVSEGNGEISREVITIASGQDLPAGQVIAKLTAGGEYVAYDNVGSDGSEVAAGILFEAVDASAAATKGLGIVRLAEVNEALLTDSDDDAKTDLAALNIIVR